MHTINVAVEDREYERLIKVKERLNLTWHDFVLSLGEKAE